MTDTNEIKMAKWNKLVCKWVKAIKYTKIVASEAHRASYRRITEKVGAILKTRLK